MKVRSLSVVLAVIMVLALASLVFAQAAPTIKTATNPTLGTFLVDGKGMSLYMYTKDTPGVSNCTGTCLTNWPALTVPAGTTPTVESGITGKLGTIKRTDNQATQVTLNDMPLYYYIKDTAAGMVTGQNVGSAWYVLDKTGAVVKTALPAAQATTAATTAPAAAAQATTAPTVAPTRAAAATTAPAAAAATATKAPGTLPVTGGGQTTSLAVILAAAGALALLGGVALSTARRTR